MHAVPGSSVASMLAIGTGPAARLNRCPTPPPRTRTGTSHDMTRVQSKSCMRGNGTGPVAPSRGTVLYCYGNGTKCAGYNGTCYDRVLQ
eukprot:2844885-Rhodomonas_salina.1